MANKRVIVTFDFDSETDTISNVLCSVDGVEKKKRTTKKQSEVSQEIEKEALITLEENKLVFNNKCVLDMDIKPEDRIVVRYEQKGKTLFPIIGQDIAFDTEGAGNKLTKSQTIAFKGKQNVVLKEFGTSFTLQPYTTNDYPEGVWKLVSLDGSSEQTVVEAPKKVAPIVPELITTGKDEEIELDELQFEF